MSQNHRVIDRPAMNSLPLVKVAATDTHRLDLKENILVSDGRLFDFTKLDGFVLVLVIDDGRLGHVIEVRREEL